MSTEPEETDDAAASAPARGSSVGGGGALLGAAKLAFIIGSYLTNTGLAWVWEETPETFGDYRVVAGLINIPNLVIIQTLLFAVSRPLAEQFQSGLPAWQPLRRRGFKLALGLGGATTALLFALADVIAGTALGDPSLATPLRVVSPIPLLYGIYAVNIGSINASRRFAHQAALDVFMAAAKCSLILGAALAGFGLAWSLGGFTAAAACALLVSVGFALWVRPAAPKEVGPIPPVAAFAGVLVAFTLLTNTLQNADVLILKRLTPIEAKESIGYYAGALLVASVPYSLMNAVALLMFPLVAALSREEDVERRQRTVREAVRVSVGLLIFMSVVGASCARDILALVFKPAYAENATDQLRLLVWGYSGYSLVVICGWILNSARRSGWALGLVGLTLAVQVGAAFTLIRSHGPNGAALAVALAGAVGAFAALLTVGRAFRAYVPVPFGLKILGAAALVVAGGGVWEVQGRPMILVKLTVLSLTFLAAAAATQAVTLEQLKALRRAA